MKSFFIFLVRFYKNFLSRLLENTLGGGCRFTPTCSEYTIKALEKYGASKGLVLGVKRFLRCHPWGSFGYDPL